MTKNHIKPTKEQLEAENQKLLEELEKPEVVEEEPKEEETPEVTPEEPVEETPEEPKEEPEEEPIKVDEKEEETQKIDYVKKYSESSREAQVLAFKNKKVAEAIDKASELPEPTEEELQAEYTDWDIMSDTEKKLAKQTLLSTKRFAMLDEIRKEEKDIDAWNEKVDKYIDDPKVLVDNPDLEGKVESFKMFATKPTRRGVDFGDLISAFLYDESKRKPTPKKGQMFESGSGGPNDKPKNKGDKITVAESEILRRTDYNKYKEYLTKGKIINEI